MLLGSPDFLIPARRARLPRYLAGRTAAGQPINEYAIGVDVFERPKSFDPKTGAVVRAEIRRLRQSLLNYYAGKGAAESVIVELTARSYVPVLRQAGVRHAADWKRRSHAVTPRTWVKRTAGLAALAGVGVGIGGPLANAENRPAYRQATGKGRMQPVFSRARNA